MKLARALIIISLIILLTGCSESYIAKVNDEIITESDFEVALNQLKVFYPDTEEEGLRVYLIESMVIDTILLQEAEKENIKASDSTVNEVYHKYLETYDNEEAMLSELEEFNYTKEQLLKDIEDQIVIEKYLARVESKNVEVNKHIEDLVDNSEIEIKE